MSEFTSGFICLRKDKNEMEGKIKVIQGETIFNSLNEKWEAFFIESEPFKELESITGLLEISKSIPILYFYNAEDHGWGYKAFHGGKEISCVEINYDIETEMAMALAEKKYPALDIVTTFMIENDRQEEWQNLLNEVTTSSEYIEKKQEQIKNKNIKSFKLFNINDDVIYKLDLLLSEKRIIEENETEFEIVEDFKKLLDIEEFSWLSYSYLSNE